jgi:hypothetical protein
MQSLSHESSAHDNASVGVSLHPEEGITLPPWAAVLGGFYEQLGLPVPRFARLDADAVPEPYHKLLVHSQDMTSTLERFYGGSLRLQVLGREHTGNTYTREVVLRIDRTARPVEYGAIRIHLRQFSAVVQQVILSEQHPFGRILDLEGIGYLSWPQSFFSVSAERHMSQLLGLEDAPALYGRRNVLLDGRRRLLAEVIEILAPVTAVADASAE